MPIIHKMGSSIYSQIIWIITNNPSVSLYKLSRILGLNRKKIQYIIKSRTGMGFREVMKSCRLCYSVHLLYSGLTVKKVASNCGYSYPENYTRAFKQYIGVSPFEITKHKSFNQYKNDKDIIRDCPCPFKCYFCEIKQNKLQSLRRI